MCTTRLTDVVWAARTLTGAGSISIGDARKPGEAADKFSESRPTKDTRSIGATSTNRPAAPSAESEDDLPLDQTKRKPESKQENTEKKKPRPANGGSAASLSAVPLARLAATSSDSEDDRPLLKAQKRPKTQLAPQARAEVPKSIRERSDGLGPDRSRPLPGAEDSGREPGPTRFDRQPAARQPAAAAQPTVATAAAASVATAVARRVCPPPASAAGGQGDEPTMPIKRQSSKALSASKDERWVGPRCCLRRRCLRRQPPAQLQPPDQRCSRRRDCARGAVRGVPPVPDHQAAARSALQGGPVRAHGMPGRRYPLHLPA